MDTLTVAAPPIRRTLTASPAMVVALHKTGVRQAGDKTPEKSPVEEDPAVVAGRRADRERQTALLITLSERWPRLFDVEVRAVQVAGPVSAAAAKFLRSPPFAPTIRDTAFNRVRLDPRRTQAQRRVRRGRRRAASAARTCRIWRAFFHQ